MTEQRKETEAYRTNTISDSREADEGWSIVSNVKNTTIKELVIIVRALIKSIYVQKKCNVVQLFLKNWTLDRTSRTNSVACNILCMCILIFFFSFYQKFLDFR